MLCADFHAGFCLLKQKVLLVEINSIHLEIYPNLPQEYYHLHQYYKKDSYRLEHGQVPNL